MAMTVRFWPHPAVMMMIHAGCYTPGSRPSPNGAIRPFDPQQTFAVKGKLSLITKY